LQLLRTAETLWNTSRVFFDRWKLGPSQFNLLNLLSDCPDGLSQNELSRRLIMHRSNVTGLVDRLEERGLLRRENCPEDRRAYRVVLTKSGQTLLREVLPYYYAAAEHVWGKIPPNRAQLLLSQLRELSANAENVVRS
jgi:MarR family 2-MHQ and catechol resistance regulon transcriptional repressor